MYRKIDMEQWPRKEHYLYYTDKLKVEFTMTAQLRVEKLLAYCHRRGYRFYAAFIALASQVVNSLENFRMFKNDEGELCVWDYVVPNYTIFHKDDQTFSDCWSEYCEDPARLYQTIVADMERFKDTKGIKARDGQPANFFCISCAPWVHFTGFSTRNTQGEPQYFPIITAGKYEKDGERLLMPVNVTLAHAVCDGYHVGLFFQRLQQAMDEIGEGQAVDEIGLRRGMDETGRERAIDEIGEEAMKEQV